MYLVLLAWPVAFLGEVLGLGLLLLPLADFVLFPILLLSAAGQISSSPIFVARAGELARAVVRLGDFYAQTFLLASVWLLTVGWGMTHSPLVTLVLSAPLTAGILLVYARLLGRVGWRIATQTNTPAHFRDRDEADRPQNGARGRSIRKNRDQRRDPRTGCKTNRFQSPSPQVIPFAAGNRRLPHGQHAFASRAHLHGTSTPSNALPRHFKPCWTR